LPDLLENSRCHKNYLKSILYLLLQVLDVGGFCSTNSRPQMSRDKNIRDLSQLKGRAMLLFHLILSIVTEIGCSIIAEVQKENVLEDHNA
jgi:hypothetical protein